MNKKIISLILSFCLIFSAVVTVFAASERENKLCSTCGFGKYVYYNYGANGKVNEFVIVDSNNYKTFDVAERNAKLKVKIFSTENNFQTIRYKMSQEEWIPVEKNVYVECGNQYRHIHYRFDNSKPYVDYEKKYVYDDSDMLVLHETVRHSVTGYNTYKIEYEYSDCEVYEYRYNNSVLEDKIHYTIDDEKNIYTLELTNELFGNEKEIFSKNDCEKTYSFAKANRANGNFITIYNYKNSTKLPFGHLDFSMDGNTYSYGTNTTGLGNYFRKMLHKEPGFLFEATTSHWTSQAPYNKYDTCNIYLNEDEVLALGASIVIIILTCTELDASSSSNVSRHKFIQGDYQYYNFTSANCVTFVLDLLYDIIPNRIDNAGNALWNDYNLSSIHTVDKAFKLLQNCTN